MLLFPYLYIPSIGTYSMLLSAWHNLLAYSHGDGITSIGSFGILQLCSNDERDSDLVSSSAPLWLVLLPSGKLGGSNLMSTFFMELWPSFSLSTTTLVGCK